MKALFTMAAAWSLLGLAYVAVPAAAQEEPAAAPSTELIDLNRAIRAYLAEDRESAAEIFDRLLASDPQGPRAVACAYYLGLIALDRGLDHATAAQAAGGEAQSAQAAGDEPAEAAALATQLDEAAAARAQFEIAQQHFENVVGQVDPTAEMVRAALLLGIAQLAKDQPASLDDEPFQLAQRAEETLTRYVSETEDGAQDRFGYFYLGVAHYRLADEYGRLRMRTEAARAVEQAVQDLERAAELAQQDSMANRITPGELEDFKTVITYYNALLSILQRDNQLARQLFLEVIERAEGTLLARNAEAVVNKLDEVQRGGQDRMTLPVPAPLGPWELEGRLQIGNAFDTNVILLGHDTALPLGIKQSEDYRFDTLADFNISRYLTGDEMPIPGESLTLGFGGSASYVWQPNITEFDVNRYSGRAYANWQPMRDLYVGLQYEYSYTMLGHDPFISSHRLTPVISWSWRMEDESRVAIDRGRTDFYYTFDDRNYLEPISDFRLERDGTYQAVGAQHTFFIVQAQNLPYMQPYFDTHEKERELFGDEWLNVYIGYAYRDERTRGTEFDLRGHSILWGVEVPLPYRLAFEVDGEFSWEDHSSASIFDYERKERSNFGQRYDFGLTYTIIDAGEREDWRTLAMKLRAGVEVILEDSNIWNRLGEDIYEYDRAIYGVRLEVAF